MKHHLPLNSPERDRYGASILIVTYGSSIWFMLWIISIIFKDFLQ